MSRDQSKEVVVHYRGTGQRREKMQGLFKSYQCMSYHSYPFMMPAVLLLFAQVGETCCGLSFVTGLAW